MILFFPEYPSGSFPGYLLLWPLGSSSGTFSKRLHAPALCSVVSIDLHLEDGKNERGKTHKDIQKHKPKLGQMART